MEDNSPVNNRLLRYEIAKRVFMCQNKVNIYLIESCKTSEINYPNTKQHASFKGKVLFHK